MNNQTIKTGSTQTELIKKPLIISAVIMLLGALLLIVLIVTYQKPEPDPMHQLLVTAEEQYKLGQYEDALSTYNECIDQFPDSTDGYIGMYRTLEALDRELEALDVFFSLPDVLDSPDINEIRDELNTLLTASYRNNADTLGYIQNDNGTYIKTCFGNDYWYYGWCEKTGVLSLSFEDLDGDGITEGIAVVIRSHQPDDDITGAFAFDLQSDAYLLIYESDGQIHEQLIARCFDSRSSFVDVYQLGSRFYIETGSKIETSVTRTYGVYEWTGTEIAVSALIHGTGDTILTLTDKITSSDIFPGGDYPDGQEGYIRALSDRLGQYGLEAGTFGSLEESCFTGGVRLCLCSGGISGSPGMRLTGKCDCSLMSMFLGNGHYYATNPTA